MQLETIPDAILPCEQGCGDKNQHCVACFAEDGESENSRENLIGFSELLSIDQKIAKTFGCTHEFCGNNEHEAET
jgi:hypothetical protein